ncbi:MULTISPECIES: 5'-methylthioadenosine/adenosylhomocysteine nucleosidase [unclassified Rubrivivax]|uniref:5'-methylthioadenosine/adenosylhomocysteine nucleosidase n=1 Tax=unclassified Rubrivivax TaxID=2649762 RepID=UPI001E56A629|nr:MULTISPECIES: 5'-methylthioadenosine/adenosylhomocysteine nucleosidase [unclassified Rubrivivax]MCC9597967.1 5'-methylthioadenosine/adenosylhomocysteine nucleosidase [Rubrivivax sp. JA1055]MCC9645776.1 5'-methylthioadenosine/adenosylhomocysteine nucleosidase [Rubrivivax sp. JA1029]
MTPDPSSPRTAAPLGIVAALRQELSDLLELMPGARRQILGNREFWHGELEGHDVVAVQSRVGKVAAAATTATLIAHYGVGAVVLTGIAGALAPGVAVGDIVVSAELLQHDLDASPFFPRFEVPLTGVSRFKADAALVERVAAGARVALADPLTLFGEQIVRDFALHAPTVHTGLIVSGDRFVRTAEDSETLRASMPDALAVEMEGAAIAQVCHEWGLPFVAIRAISDRADDDAHADFSRFLREVCARYGAAVIRGVLAGAPPPLASAC